MQGKADIRHPTRTPYFAHRSDGAPEGVMRSFERDAQNMRGRRNVLPASLRLFYVSKMRQMHPKAALLPVCAQQLLIARLCFGCDVKMPFFLHYRSVLQNVMKLLSTNAVNTVKTQIRPVSIVV
jgi:hypothetical protein